MTVRIARVYDEPDRGAGERRVLVDRLWPRGVRKEALDLDEWPKGVAPSDGLRRWYGHDPARFEEFARRYRLELASEPAAAELSRLRQTARREPLVLLTATRDVDHSGAVVLRDVIEARER